MQRVQELFEAYKDMVYRLALSYLGNTDDAQDISQEVFLRLLLCRISGQILPPQPPGGVSSPCPASLILRKYPPSIWIRPSTP